MKKKLRYFQGYTLLELLLVITIFVILGSLGIGGYIRTKETMVAKENVQRIIQDIQIARSKAMLLEKGSETNWIYGVGIDFRDTDEDDETGNYKFFKWCSPFTNFGDEMTRSELLSYSSSQAVGVDLATSRDLNGCTATYENGLLPLCYTDSCIGTYPSLVAVKGDDLGLVDKEVGKMIVPDVDDEGHYPAFIVFEAITGRAFIYNRYGWSNNYRTVDGTFNINNIDHVFDIILPRKYSSKFDLITIYPLSGTVIHHVYGTKDFRSDGVCPDGDFNCITYDGKSYNRYGIEQEINSYRD